MAFRYQPNINIPSNPGGPGGNVYQFQPLSGSGPPQPLSGYVLPPAAVQPATVAAPTSALSVFGFSFKSFAIFMSILCAIIVTVVVTTVVLTKKDAPNSASAGITSPPGSTTMMADHDCQNSLDFNCGAGVCIPQSKVCDGHADCGWNTRDEDNCGFASTATTTQNPLSITTTYIADLYCPNRADFNCGAGVCIPQSKVCNNVSDCGWNNRDEENCSWSNPPKQQFSSAPIGPTTRPLSWGTAPDSGVPGFSGFPTTQFGSATYRTTTDWEYVCQRRGEFSCGFSTCIPYSMVCDTHKDCRDGRDEMNCTCDPISQFNCSNSRMCIANTSVCDYIKDCTDGSDEANCTYRACNSTEFECNSGQCVPANRTCDRYVDCYDGSDEYHCPCNNTLDFKCNDTGMCISIRSKCNYYNDCRDGSDEVDCTCDSQLHFQCQYSRSPLCIPLSSQCDMIWDCSDGSDERGCPCNRTDQFKCDDGQCISRNRTCNFYQDCYGGSDEANCTFPPCNISQFQCKNKQCIPLSKRCDNNYYDCIDSSDEQHCPCNASYQYTCNSTGDCLYLGGQCDGYANCPGGDDETNCDCNLEYQFQCGTFNPRCIGKHLVCDLNYDCNDRSDEMNCPCNKSDQFKCANGQCVRNYTRCNFYKDCEDGSDELNCNYPACNTSQFKCANGQCLYSNYSRCNGYAECIDKSDEKFCPCDSKDSQFMCNDGQCIQSYERCNRYATCDDKSDEANCSAVCGAPVHTCANGFCLNTKLVCQNRGCKSFWCDGYTDCPDESDELNCTYYQNYQTTTPFWTNTPTRWWFTTWAQFTMPTSTGGDGITNTLPDIPTGSLSVTNTSSNIPSNFTSLPQPQTAPLATGRPSGLPPVNQSSPLWWFPTTTSSIYCNWNYNQRRCNNGNCVYFRYWCDGGDDCGDGTDELNCTQQNLTLFQDNFLVFTSVENPGLYQYSTDTGAMKQILAAKPVNPRAVAVDTKNKNIYYTEMTTQTIRKVAVGSRQESVIYSHAENLTDFEGLTVDSVAEKLYFTAQMYGTGFIYELTISSGSVRELWNKNSSNPRGIVVEPGKGNLYWTECNMANIGIVSTTVSNSKVIKFIINKDIVFPQSLAIDFDKGVMYWADIYLYRIEAANLDGSQRRVIASESYTTFYAITISPVYIYLADWSTSYFKRFNRYSHSATKLYDAPGFSSIVGLAYYSTKKAQDSDCKGPGEFQCAKSWCIGPAEPCAGWWCDTWNVKCDGVPDCPDKSDEAGCTAIVNNRTCAPGQFECKDGSCVSMTYICSGYPQCRDRSDVSYCLSRGCPEGRFQCQDTAECIGSWGRCDGYKSCGDASDELNCNCTTDQFKCANESMCIWDWMRCDGQKDCRDGSDEKQCDTCPVGKFRCNNGTCVYNNSRCSIYSQNCPDGSDNMGCDDCVARGGFLCNNGQCVPQSSVCNPYASIHCADHSDEVNCNCTAKGMFQCDSGECIPSYAQCQFYSYYKCRDGSHLKNCNNTCTKDQFNCDNGECVWRTNWCNVWNSSSCQDKSDLKYCKCKITDIYCNRTGECIDGKKWCDGVRDCEDGYDESFCYFGSCPPNYFSCDTFFITTTMSRVWNNQTQCVPMSKRCDGVIDCANMGDEAFSCYCDPNTQFQCNNGRCINGSVWCDGKQDCSDGSDEPNNCEDECNPFRYMTCNNGRCVDKSAKCDGVNNCGDYSDEINCTCYSDSYRCDMGLCLDKEVFCNGTKECPDGSDEKENCEFMCQPGYFTCNNSRCVYGSYSLCNGVNDCGDYSDELNCPCSSSNNYFRCDMGVCVEVQYYCDGYRECPDGSDEKPDCKSKCPPGFFRCNGTGQCLSQSLICDKYFDCPDGSDEQNCNCTTNQYKCSSGYCIPKSWLCDGTKDCKDGDDELPTKCTAVCTGTQHQCTSDRTCVDQKNTCDGLSDCIDYTDEYNCFGSAATGSVVNGFQTQIVSVKYEGVSNNYICADGWNDTWNDLICQEMGYGSAQTRSSNTGPVGQYKTLKVAHPFSVAADNILAYFDVATTCTGNKVLGLNCSNLECGKRKVTGSVGPYIVNGAVAVPGAWPWQATFFQYGSVMAGGAILSDRWILTAANPFEYISVRVNVVVGVGSTNRSMNDSTGKIYNIDKMVKNPAYTNPNKTFYYEGDMALVKLSKPMTFSQYVQPICLPDPFDEPQQFKVCVATGFGGKKYNYGYNDGKEPQNLLQGKMNPMTESACRAAYNGSFYLSEDWYKGMFCAGAPANEYGSSTCWNDWGGPLQCKDAHDNWSVLGIASSNPECRLGGFTRVTAYLSWIKETMANN